MHEQTHTQTHTAKVYSCHRQAILTTDRQSHPARNLYYLLAYELRRTLHSSAVCLSVVCLDVCAVGACVYLWYVFHFSASVRVKWRT